MVIILSQDIVKDDLLDKVEELSWEAKKISDEEESHERRKKANKLGMRGANYTLELLEAGKKEIALEIGMNSIFLFYIGRHFGQVLNSIEALYDYAQGTRFEEDISYYRSKTKKRMNNFENEKIDAMDALYTLIWKNGILGTTEAHKKMKEKYNIKRTNPSINKYSDLLAEENRIYRLGGPSGYPIEMFIDQTVSLSREMSYGKTAFFEGYLKEKGPDNFKRLWDETDSNARVFEIENGTNPSAFAILESPIEAPYFDGTITDKIELGIFGELHPIQDMPDYGFRPKQSEVRSDFIVNCEVRGEFGR